MTKELYEMLGADGLTGIGTSLTTVTTTKPFRRVYFVNNGATTITIGIDANPAAGKQIVLAPNEKFNESISGSDFRYKSSDVSGKLIYALLG